MVMNPMVNSVKQCLQQRQEKYCGRKKPCTTWDTKNPVNNVISYQPQLVQDFFHQQYFQISLHLTNPTNGAKIPFRIRRSISIHRKKWHVLYRNLSSPVSKSSKKTNENRKKRKKGWVFFSSISLLFARIL